MKQVFFLNLSFFEVINQNQLLENCYLIENQLLSVYANWFSSDIIELKDVSPSVNYVSYNSAALPIETKGKIFRVPIEKAWNHSSQNIPFLQNCIDSIFSRGFYLKFSPTSLIFFFK